MGFLNVATFVIYALEKFANKIFDFWHLKNNLFTIIYLHYKNQNLLFSERKGIGILQKCRTIFDPTVLNIKTKQAITKKNIIHLWIT